LALISAATANTAGVLPKRYECHSKKQTCLPMPHGTPAEQGMGLEQCQAVCGVGSLWPSVAGTHNVGEESVSVDACQLSVTYDRTKWDGTKVGDLIKRATANFVDTVARDGTGVFPPADCTQPWWQRSFNRLSSPKQRSPLEIHLDIEDAQSELTLDADESYKLSVEHTNVTRTDPSRAEVTITPILVKISAKTFFGARHGLETLSQLMNYDEANDLYAIPSSVEIEDKPAYRYRGLMIDSSRQFLTASFIKQQLRAMSYNKMNTLHWHLTDSASFPVETPSVPKVHQYGAYGPDKVYTTEDVEDIVQYGTSLGIRVIPEIDIPAHAWAGWEWGPEEGKGDLVMCGTDATTETAWDSHALEPPSGQLNIANPEVLPLLGSVYHDMVKAFGAPDLFHLGGDEVIVGSPDMWGSCYNMSGSPVAQHIVDNGGDLSDPHEFYKLIVNFTKDATKELDAAYTKNDAKASKYIQWAGNNHANHPVIYNMFTWEQHYKTACPPEKFIPMVWDRSQMNDGKKNTASIVPRLINEGYEVILSNVDFTYLDCGGPGWAAPGSYWCNNDYGDGYAEWFGMYDYPSSVQKLWGLTAEQMQKQIVGSQALMWGETADEQNFNAKVWPRTAALAGSLWAHDYTTSFASNAPGVSDRILYHRERMVKRGISAEALRTYWCVQNGNACMLSNTHKQQKAELNECSPAQVAANKIAKDTDSYPEGGLKEQFCMTRPFDCDGRQDVAPEDRLECPKHWPAAADPEA